MSRIHPDRLAEFRQALEQREELRAVLAELEALHRVVFHAQDTVDWGRVRRSAEQILLAELESRYHGNPEGLRNALLAMERGGKPWAAAVRDLAATIHAFYTTPLGLVMRKNLFGPDAVFISFLADEWIRGTTGSQP